MRVYLDTCVYNRPFDDQSQPRIWMESLAFALILQWVEGGAIKLVGSSVLQYENSRNPVDSRRHWVERCLRLASVSERVDDLALERARSLEAGGIHALDALHLASAESAGSVYFVTCDDRLIQRYSGRMKALDPASFVRLMSGELP